MKVARHRIGDDIDEFSRGEIGINGVMRLR